MIKALLERNPNLPADEIEEVIFGNANQAGEDNRNVARMSALLAGLPITVGGTTVNRLCGSGLDAVILCSKGDCDWRRRYLYCRWYRKYDTCTICHGKT